MLTDLALHRWKAHRPLALAQTPEHSQEGWPAMRTLLRSKHKRIRMALPLLSSQGEVELETRHRLRHHERRCPYVDLLERYVHGEKGRKHPSQSTGHL